mmetsp:Transcript_29683/g.54767  ORF Transcript_29683/g.54767 Transcript_29683/m.54767 type:complete len:269 (-) Transcript_29683:69-875(-)
MIMSPPRLALLLAFLAGTALSFAPSSLLHNRRHAAQIKSIPTTTQSTTTVVLSSSGSDQADSGVDNPFKNPSLLDPARLLSPRLHGCNLYLIGMMGSGKSAVGKSLARRMGTYNFLDTDAIIEDTAGKPIPQIFEDDGEAAFRDAEAESLASVCAQVRGLVSTGGGLPMRKENFSKMQSGLVVFLDVDPKVIIKRIEGTDRPLLQTENPLETLQDLMKDRKGTYEQADVIVKVTADMDVEMTVDECLRGLHGFLDDTPLVWVRPKAKA